MEKILLASALSLLGVAVSLADQVAVQESSLTEVACPSASGEMKKFALTMYVFDPQPTESYGPLVVVHAIEERAAGSGQRERVWQRIESDTKGSSQTVHWSGILTCGQKGSPALAFVLASASIRHKIDAYQVDFSKRVPDAPVAKGLADGSDVFDKPHQPPALATLLTEFESCALKLAEGEWRGSDFNLTLKPESRECKEFSLSFDSKESRFKNIPKGWSILGKQELPR